MRSGLFRTTSTIVAVARSGRIVCARKLFDEMPHRDSIAWNAMLAGYSQSGHAQEALSLFSHMRVADMVPDHFSFTAVLSASADAGELLYGKKIHALVIGLGYQSYLPVCNSLIDMYGKCYSPGCAVQVFNAMNLRNEVSWCSALFVYVKAGRLGDAHELFDSMPTRGEFAWNIMIAGYAHYGEIELCLSLFKHMQRAACRPDLCTFTGLMNACAEVADLSYGIMVHGCIIKSGWSFAVEANNSVLSFYAKLSCLHDAVKAFASATTRTQVSWNAMIDAFMKVGDIDCALALFWQSPEKNIISWTAMISGYARNGHGEEAIVFFVDMMSNLIKPDDFTFGAVLHACSNLAVLGCGRMVHGSAFRHGFHSLTYVGNGLVNMYTKCGDLQGSWQAFTEIINKDLVSWNAMLFGFGLHGKAFEAVKLYEEMVGSGLRPDKVTFIGLLMTCSHSGLIEQGLVFFESMVSVYGLAQEADHITCMVDMLGRAGYLKEARELVEEYSSTVSMKTSSNEALLGACVAHGNVGLGAMVGEDLMIIEPQREASYVLLSNLYCASGQWKEAEKVRKALVEQGVKKMPACSWIEVGNRVMVFVAGKHSYPHMEDLYKILNFVKSEMRNPNLFGFENYKAFHSLKG
ncbi:pentatricopeptide repeat-containing protein At2g36980, mitochondrial [Telopea speciosissima]|uniref:pentatricopeptide repeat-containing protein At2g36980, mitochondrial n=1 Tax=Telopea speciosissima TaxID=54955 RepID=UPI001CC7FF93|nr:pentatricopeptide repeat-containing protein At2g36980, mitochondrial [Telopea speciosissima]